MNRNRLCAATVAASLLSIGAYSLTSWPQGGQATTVYDSQTMSFRADVPHTATAAEMDMLMQHPPEAPAPAGFTLEDYGHVKAILTGYVDPMSGDSHVLVIVRDFVADIEKVTIEVNSSVVAVAGRSSGGGIFHDRGQFTYVTISMMVNPSRVRTAKISWLDAQQQVSGHHEMGF